MSTGEFSIDQLMELAGLAVAKTIYKEYPPNEQQPQPRTSLIRIKFLYWSDQETMVVMD